MSGPESRPRRSGAVVLRQMARRLRPAPPPLTVEDRQLRWARRIVEFGILDREYFETMVGRRFDSDIAAIEFYMLNDGSRGLSLSPLIEPEWLNDQQPDSRFSWYDFLHQESTDLVATSPVFDAARYVAELDETDRAAVTTTLGALRHFVRHADSTTLMPVSPGRRGERPTWGRERARSLAVARAFADSQHRTRRRYRPEWGGADTAEARTRYAAGLARLQTERPLVSIVLPTHNRAAQLERAMLSVSDQTYDNWQLIVVDDGSTDETPAVVERLSARDPRMTPVAQAPSGASAARNTGLAAATGTHIAFLDSDNAWRSTHLELALAALLQEGASAVHTGLRMIGLNNTGDAADESKETFRGEEGDWNDLVAGNFIDLNALVVEASAARSLGGFDTTLKRWIDYDYVLRLSRDFGVPRYVDHLSVDYDNTFDPSRLSSREGASWQEVALASNVIDWAALADAAHDRPADLVSIVIPVYREWRMTRRAIDAVLADADRGGASDREGASDSDSASDHGAPLRIEVVVIDNASQRSVSATLAAWFAAEPRVRILRQDRNRNFALGSDLGLAASTGAHVVMLNNDTEVQPGWLAPLVDELSDPAVLGAQPLLLYPNGTVQAAGTVFGGDKVLPWHFLAAHPRSDAARADQRSFSAITAAAAIFRAGDLIRWRGFDPIFANGLEDVDLCLRALDERLEGRFSVVPESVVVHHESVAPGRSDAQIANRRHFDERWQGRYPRIEASRYAAAGLVLAGIEAGEPKGHDVLVRSSRPLIVRPPRDVSEGSWAGRPSLRWSLKHEASTFAEADALASRLRDLGQEVVLDAPDAWYRSSASLDDVAVALLRNGRFVPQPGAVNVLVDPALASDPLVAPAFRLQIGAGARVSAQALDDRERLIFEALGAGDGLDR